MGVVMNFTEFLASAVRTRPELASPEIEAQCTNWEDVAAVIEFGPDHEFWILELTDGKFYVDLDGTEHLSRHRDDVARALYGWAVTEGYLDADPVRDALIRLVRSSLCECATADPVPCARCAGVAALGFDPEA
jgi:hypothetical protein